MFPVDQLARFDVNSVTYKFVKPWWDVFTDYLVTVMLIMAVLLGAKQATQGNLFCIPAVDCNFPLDQHMPDSGSNSFCRAYNYSATRSSRMTVLIKLQDRRQYDFVEAECGRKAVNPFASYLPYIMFFQAMILIVVDNFWLKFPMTSSILEHFATLVIECNNTPGTCLAVSNVLWNTNLSEDVKGKVSRDVEQGSRDRQSLLRSTSHRDGEPGSPVHVNSNTANVSLEVSEAIKAKTLYEKMRQFRMDIEVKQRHILITVYLAQAITQFVLSLVFLCLNIGFHSTLKKTVHCNIDEIISKNYIYFKCEHVLIPYFQITLVIFNCLIGLYFFLSSYICYWSISKKEKMYEFKIMKENEDNRRVTGDEDTNYTLLLSDIPNTSGDLAFMLRLLDKYNKLYSLRFAVFLSQKNEKKIKDFILTKEWPIEKLQMNTQDGGRTLKLTKLCGIPKTVFEMAELDSLILENCTLSDDDFDRENWPNLRLRSLSLIKCCLTSIPTAILEMSSLATLDLSHNRIESIPLNIINLVDLHTLNIASNNVIEGVEHIFAMENLKVLNLRENNFFQFSSPPHQPTLMRLYINERMFENMTEETRIAFEKVIVTNEVLARDVLVVKYSPDKAPHIEQVRKNREKVYKMTSNPKGLAIIINIFRYDSNCLPQRTGSDVDVEKLQKLFDGIGYEVECVSQDRVRTVEMYNVELSDLLKRSDFGSIILVMMTHGTAEGMFLESGEIISVEEIVDLFQLIDRLQGKPKLVFIQACRGSREIVPRKQQSPIVGQKNMEEVEPLLSTPDSVPHGSVCTAESTLNVSLPSYSDVLIAYSTLHGFVSLRNSQHGSWFVQAVVDVFSKYAWEEDLLSLLTYVNYEVSRKLTMQGYRQVPAPQSTLTKKLFFLPGYFEDN